VTVFVSRIGGNPCSFPTQLLCDAWLADGLRFGDELAGLDSRASLGRWPGELETDAVVRLAQAVGDATWESQESTPPVAQRLAERARLQPLDLELLRHLQHLQHVCHRPRLHLRVEEERLSVSRARRTPVRAVAELVSHPGDWEHRTLRSIHPSRVLARQIEDEWNLYENRVVVELVDHLLVYVAKRLEELHKIKQILDASPDHQGELRRTSFWRANRITELWSSTLDSKTEEELDRTIQRLALTRRDLQTLLSTPLYQRVPRRQSVALSLKPTNILVNDTHYRKVAVLWRAWAQLGHKHQETHEQRTTRRQCEAAAWDRFVLQLIVRGFRALGWTASPPQGARWEVVRSGWAPVSVVVDERGVVHISANAALRFVPLCADLSGADPSALLAQLQALDRRGDEVVLAHVGGVAPLADSDRALAWSLSGRAVLFACSPWSIDSEERMARLLNGWLNRTSAPDYPLRKQIRHLPEIPHEWDWLRHEGDHLAGLRAPDSADKNKAIQWVTTQSKKLQSTASQGRAARQSLVVSQRDALVMLQAFIDLTDCSLRSVANCPVCGGQGDVTPRFGKGADGSDATWWASCHKCESEWGLRPCTGCGSRFRALVVQCGIDLGKTDLTSPGWPDAVLGRDVWAPPCRAGTPAQFRCPECGTCSCLNHRDEAQFGAVEAIDRDRHGDERRRSSGDTSNRPASLQAPAARRR
jgi:hypothetical protein